MIQYESIDVSEVIYINKSDKSKECMTCHYWNVKDIVNYFTDIINMNSMLVTNVMIYQWWFMI